MSIFLEIFGIAPGILRNKDRGGNVVHTEMTLKLRQISAQPFTPRQWNDRSQ